MTKPNPGPGEYRCEMCRGIFAFGWSDEEARKEAEDKGIDPNASSLVCDDCYRLTPWGRP